MPNKSSCVRVRLPMRPSVADLQLELDGMEGVPVEDQRLRAEGVDLAPRCNPRTGKNLPFAYLGGWLRTSNAQENA